MIVQMFRGASRVMVANDGEGGFDRARRKSNFFHFLRCLGALPISRRRQMSWSSFGKSAA